MPKATTPSITVSLDAEQREAVKAPLYEPIAVLAGPGSGKTTVISHRYAYLISKKVKPEKILAVTFSTSMASEMKTRIQSVTDSFEAGNISTIHAFCFRFLKSMGINKDKAEEWVVKQTIQDACMRQSWDKNWAIVRWWIDKSKMDGCRQSAGQLTDYFTGKVPLNEVDRYLSVSGKLFAVLEEQNKTTFPDMINDTWQGLKDNPDWLKEAKRRYDYVLIDEAQDTMPIALDILQLICPKRIFVVGDPDQTLYRFTGADPEHNLFRFDTVIKLQTNYRSPGKIVDAANALILNNYDSSNKRFLKKMKPVAKRSGVLSYTSFELPSDEAAYISSVILDKKIEPGKVFVGARTNSQLPYLEREFYRKEIPYVVVGDTEFFNRSHIKSVVYYMRLSQNPNDKEAFRGVYNIASNNMRNNNGKYVHHRWLGNAFLLDCEKTGLSYWQACLTPRISQNFKYKFGVQDLVRFMKYLDSISTEAPQFVADKVVSECYLKHHVYSMSGLAIDPMDTDNIVADIAVLLDISKQYSTMSEFLDFVKKMQSTRRTEKKKQRSVIISTIHRLKGLERDVVFGVGFSEGLLPHKSVLTPAEMPNLLNQSSLGTYGNAGVPNNSTMTDERCIAFVLVTRAKKDVYLSSVKYWNGQELKPSRFIAELNLA